MKMIKEKSILNAWKDYEYTIIHIDYESKIIAMESNKTNLTSFLIQFVTEDEKISEDIFIGNTYSFDESDWNKLNILDIEIDSQITK